VRAAVLGSPIAHSLSPRLHRAAYVALGLDWTYDAVELSGGDLPAFLAGLGPEWAGLSLTMPLKQAVLPLLDAVDPLARALGAANTVLLREGQRVGHNTDVAGIANALREAGVVAASAAVVLGGGATARAALAALLELGVRTPQVLVRVPDRAGPLLEVAARLGVHPVIGQLEPAVLARPGHQVVVSTTPAGVLDALAGALSLPPDPPTLLDVVYHPWPTRLAEVYDAAGGTVVAGTAMLLHQAAAQVELMTGRPAPLAAMSGALGD